MKPVFGQDPPPAPVVSMAYVGRNPKCLHARVIVLDNRASSLTELVEAAHGLMLERIPVSEAQAAFKECDVCREPEQVELGLAVEPTEPEVVA